MPATATRKKPAAAKKPQAGKTAKTSSPIDNRLISIMVFAGLIIAVVPALNYANDTYRVISPLKYLAAVGTGFVTGMSGNPAALLMPGGLLEMLGAGRSIKEFFPTTALAAVFPLSSMVFIVSAACGFAGTRDGIKRGWLRYEPALVMAALALAGMAAAWWAKSVSPLFNDLMSSVANSPYFLGAVFFIILFLGAAKLLSGGAATNRHWLLSVAAGPVTGFWVGYLGEHWFWFLAALLLFVYVIVLNERIMGILVSIPLVMSPICAAKIFYDAGGASPAVLLNRDAADWPAVAAIGFSFVIGHIFMLRVMEALPAGVRRGVFFTSYIVFMIFFIIRL